MNSRLWIGWGLLAVFFHCGQQPPLPRPIAAPRNPESYWRPRSGEVGHGDTLEKIVVREEIGPEQRLSFINAFASVFDVRKIIVGKSYAIYVDSTGRFQRFDYFAEAELTVRVYPDSTRLFRAELMRRPLIKKIKTVRGFITTTLYQAMVALGETPELIVLFSDVFQWDLDFFSDPQKGDEFRLICEAYYLADSAGRDSVGSFIRYGKILAGEYIQPGRVLTAVYFQTTPDRGAFYDMEGKSFQKTFLKSPILYGKVTSRFSGARFHPILKIVRSHYAIDISAPGGTPISAPADGTIIEKGYNENIGNYIKIRHQNPHFVTVYGHLSSFGEGMEVGARVRQRDEIGFVGSTGLSTGPHLHFIFYENGHPINPERIKNSAGDPIPDRLLESYRRSREKLLRLLNAMPVQVAFTDTIGVLSDTMLVSGDFK